MNVVELKLSQITSKTENHRTKDSEQDVANLMASIKKTGLINPVTVKRQGKGYVLIAGFRRLMAMKKLKRESISANVIASEMSDTAINLVENLQRENTTSYEVGRGIHRMMGSDNLSEAEVSVLLGLSRAVVKQYLSLFKETPVKYRAFVRNIGRSKGEKRNGVIPNNVAAEIINSQKCGRITAKEKASLFEDALKGKISLQGMRAVSTGTAKKDQVTTTINVTLTMTPAHKKKLGIDAHKKIRRLVQKEFKIKVLNL